MHDRVGMRLWGGCKKAYWVKEQTRVGRGIAVTQIHSVLVVRQK